MDQGGSFGGFKIDKLTASNYHTWKQKIELVLAFRELNEVVFNIASTDVLQADREVRVGQGPRYFHER